jgi:hypothetical protein
LLRAQFLTVGACVTRFRFPLALEVPLIFLIEITVVQVILSLPFRVMVVIPAFIVG